MTLLILIAAAQLQAAQHCSGTDAGTEKYPTLIVLKRRLDEELQGMV